MLTKPYECDYWKNPHTLSEVYISLAVIGWNLKEIGREFFLSWLLFSIYPKQQWFVDSSILEKIPKS